ncbi:MAG: hypothetical protein IKD79_04635, partial [Oscillospiraceae bacterium]|nr:hypothetical protein [Oscillospiraceae bacterium]
MKFDTRDKKPKLYSLLIEAVVTAGLQLLLVKRGAQENGVYICALTALFFLAASIQLAVAFFRQIQYNPYSYNTIYYMGFALFFCFIWILQIYIAVQM